MIHSFGMTYDHEQSCGTVMIYCSFVSGSSFGKVPISVPVPAPAPVPAPEPNRAFSILEATLFPRKLASHFYFLTFVFHFMLDPDLNPVPVPLRQKKLQFLRFPAPVPLKQKVAVPAVPVPQH